MKTAASASDRVEASLDAIARHNPSTNAFILVDAEGARAAARAADEERRRGVDRGPLHGMPISIKDLIDVAGQPTTAGSRVRAGHVAERDAPVIQRLREAGAVLIGKTNLHEFALGTTSEESAFGAVHNPRDLARSAGGSSGGSAAAVASGMGVASIGSDTGGSIRIPAAVCGIVGLKPSIGEVPTEAVVPLSTTLDHVGPLTRSVTDAADCWAVLSGRRPPTVVAPAAREVTLGTLGDYFTALLDADVRAVFDAAIEHFRRSGVRLGTRSVPGTAGIVDAYVNVSLAEAAHWHAPTLDSKANDYQPPVRERLERGRTITAVNYLRGLDTCAALALAVDSALEGCDALVLPSVAIVAPLLGTENATMDNGESLLVRAAMLRLTQLFNMTGNPAISLPIPTSGLPVGLQLVGKRGETEALLATALACEQLLGTMEAA
jgi:aspartyl-tRNA(Asn)/glutamyl-tRNA(Gln) amidotransferase subunit A